MIQKFLWRLVLFWIFRTSFFFFFLPRVFHFLLILIRVFFTISSCIILGNPPEIYRDIFKNSSRDSIGQTPENPDLGTSYIALNFEIQTVFPPISSLFLYWEFLQRFLWSFPKIFLTNPLFMALEIPMRTFPVIDEDIFFWNYFWNFCRFLEKLLQRMNWILSFRDSFGNFSRDLYKNLASNFFGNFPTNFLVCSSRDHFGNPFQYSIKKNQRFCRDFFYRFFEISLKKYLDISLKNFSFITYAIFFRNFRLELIRELLQEFRYLFPKNVSCFSRNYFGYDTQKLFRSFLKIFFQELFQRCLMRIFQMII